MNSKVLNNASWIIFSKIVQSVMSLVVSIITVRYLGPANYGIINYAGSLVMFVLPIIQLGITNILVQELIAHNDSEGEILGTSIALSIFSSFLCMISVVIFSALANPGEKVTIIVCALYSISLLFQATEMLQYWFQTHLLSKYTSIIATIVYFVISAYKISLLILKMNVYWFVFTHIFDHLLISLGLFFLYKKFGGKKLVFTFDTAKRLLAKGKYYIVSSMMTTVFAQTDKIMLKAMLDETAVGYYSAAITCTNLFSFVFIAIIDSMRPVILEKKLTDENECILNLKSLYAIIIYLALSQCIVWTLFAKPIVLILYGEQYLPTVAALQLSVWYTTFSYIGSVRNIWILMNDKYKYLWIINLSGVCANIILNYLLIPIAGINGAATASVFTQFFTNVIVVQFIKPIRITNKIMFCALHPKYLMEMCSNFIKKGTDVNE